MCYATALRKPKEVIERALKKTINATFTQHDTYQPYYHLNGFSYGNLQIIKMDDTANSYPASWGLVPDWAKNDPSAFRKKSNTLNARGESIFKKNSFKKSALEKRCLILADGFFEPHHVNNVSIPYFCFQPSTAYSDGALFMYAGLYNELDNGLLTATIITVEANAFFAEVHNKKKRMPLVLDQQYYQDWLDKDLNASMVNNLVATGFTSKTFDAHPVSRDVYKKGINTNKAYIIDKVDKGTLF